MWSQKGEEPGYRVNDDITGEQRVWEGHAPSLAISTEVFT